MKKFIIVGNWKLNGNYDTIYQFISNLKKYILNNSLKHTIVISPPILYTYILKNKIHHENFFIGAQNVDVHECGAFTGEISASMLKDIGIQYVIIGHSERRKFHNEDNNIIAQKFKLLKDENIIPIVCLGETLIEKQECKTEKICINQIDSILSIVGENAFKNSIIAYEPIWSIGTGKTANVQYVNKVIRFIKKYISENSNININDIIIQYGGSINEHNIKDFYLQHDINGVLLGSVACSYKKFINVLKIINNI